MRCFELRLTVAEARVDERPEPQEPPVRLVARLARLKATAPIDAPPAQWRLAADTIVDDAGEVLGKPVDAEEARRMLRRLRGRMHLVHTAVALYRPADERLFLRRVTTQVWMRRYPEAALEAYIAAGEPFDKAGGYAIQDSDFAPVERIEGCYANVVGLPLCAVAALLHEAGLLRRTPDLPACCRRHFGWQCPRREEGVRL